MGEVDARQESDFLAPGDSFEETIGAGNTYEWGTAADDHYYQVTVEAGEQVVTGAVETRSVIWTWVETTGWIKVSEGIDVAITAEWNAGTKQNTLSGSVNGGSATGGISGTTFEVTGEGTGITSQGNSGEGEGSMKVTLTAVGENQGEDIEDVELTLTKA